MEVVVAGGEFGKVSLANSKKKRNFKKMAVKWYRDHVQGKTARNSILGRVDFTDIGGHELRGPSKKPDKFFLLPYLTELIETSADVELNVRLNDDPKMRKFLERGWKIHYDNNTFVRDNSTYSVRIVILEDEQGKKFYALGNPKKLKNEKPRPT
jgi:hypothetical protein